MSPACNRVVGHSRKRPTSQTFVRSNDRARAAAVTPLPMAVNVSDKMLQSRNTLQLNLALCSGM